MTGNPLVQASAIVPGPAYDTKETIATKHTSGRSENHVGIVSPEAAYAHE